jgi:hypothetical protein
MEKKTINKESQEINFDFVNYYRSFGELNNEISKMKKESEYFRYYDSLTKEQQQIFKTLDRKVRASEADFIQSQILEISKSMLT